MITPDYVRLMTRYNGEMNARLYAAAARLPEAERRRDRGAFFRSIHETLSHLLWADTMWMARFDGWRTPDVSLAGSATCYPDFAQMAATRRDVDERMLAWAETLGSDWLAGRLAWRSGAAQRDMEAPRAMLVMHLFNHQTHHRGQVHAMLTAAGETTGDTDLMLVLPS